MIDHATRASPSAPPGPSAVGPLVNSPGIRAKRLAGPDSPRGGSSCPGADPAKRGNALLIFYRESSSSWTL